MDDAEAVHSPSRGSFIHVICHEWRQSCPFPPTCLEEVRFDLQLGAATKYVYINYTTPQTYASLSGVAHTAPVLQSSEAVPFRFTPNMQHFVTPNGMEGLMTSGIMAIGRCLTEPEVSSPSFEVQISNPYASQYDLEQQLNLFLRDEVLTWYSHHTKQPSADIVFRTHVSHNVDVVVKRAEVLACKFERENVSSNN